MIFKRQTKLIYSIMLFAILVLCWSSCFMVTSAAVKPGKVTNVNVTASGTKHTIRWNRVEGVTGYQVYCKDYSSSTKKYKKVKTVSGTANVSAVITGRKTGKAYAYIVRAYKKSGKKVYYGNLSSIAYGYSSKQTAVNNTASSSSQESSLAGIITNPTKAQKYKQVFNNSKLSMRYPGGYYKNASSAASNMTSVTVKTWDFKSGNSGEKYTRTWTIKVHKNLAPTVVKIFDEIYNGSEKFPIHELGGYDWRGGHSEHNTGTAIDINWTENYMVNVKTGKITAGKYWKPGTDPYSIAKNGEVAKIFKKYGFSQGDWGNSKDYMHFSYFGT